MDLSNQYVLDAADVIITRKKLGEKSKFELVTLTMDLMDLVYQADNWSQHYHPIHYQQKMTDRDLYGAS